MDCYKLRTQIDNLKWEVNRLDVENRRLREEDPAARERVDLESELQQAKETVSELTERATMYETQMEGLKRQLAVTTDEQSESRRRLEETTRELDGTHDEVEKATQELEATKRELAEATHRFRVTQARVEDLEAQVQELSQAVVDRERQLGDLQEKSTMEKEGILRQAELDRYRAQETERERWEAREQRLVDQLEALTRELSAHKEEMGGVMYTSLREQLAVTERQLQEVTEELHSGKADWRKRKENKR